MKPVRVFLVVVVLMLAMSSAAAHPLGNFTINVHLRLAVGQDELLVQLVIDMAEIPTFREEIGDDYEATRCAGHAEEIDLSHDGAALDLRLTDTALSFPPGQAGLDTLRLECDYVAPLSSLFGELSIDNRVYEDRLGWAEIVVVGADSDLPAESSSGVLTNYPTGEVSEVRSGVAQLTGEAAVVGSSESPTIVERVGSGLSEGPWFLALLAALGLGTGHALAPGHGKTLMAAYLVGKRGGVPQAALLGLTVAIAHTIGVGVLGLVTAVATSQFRPESVYPWLSGLAAAIVTVIGLTMLYRALRRKGSGVRDQGSDPEDDHGHTHEVGHDHEHELSHHHEHGHDHSHHEPTGFGWRSLATLGLAGGLVPSASAVVLLLGAISRGEPWWGLILVIAFGLGMAATLVAAGLAVVFAARFGLKLGFASRWRLERYMPVIGGIVVTLIGFGLLLQAALAST